MWGDVDSSEAGRPSEPDGTGTRVARVRLFGSVEVCLCGTRVGGAHWRRARVQLLFAVLALEGRCTRRWLAGNLWPDMSDAPAANNLRVTLSYLRAALREAHGDPVAVESDRDAVWLSPGFRWILDVREFEHLAGTRRGTDGTGEPERAEAARLGYALGQHRGELLSQLDLPDRFAFERERLRARALHVALRLGELLLRIGEPDKAMDAALQARRLDPWSEHAGLLEARALVDLHDRAGALRTLRHCIEQDADLGMPPSAELRDFLGMIEDPGVPAVPPG